jgi:Protein of unknown function (DUF3606)
MLHDCRLTAIFPPPHSILRSRKCDSPFGKYTGWNALCISRFIVRMPQHVWQMPAESIRREKLGSKIQYFITYRGIFMSVNQLSVNEVPVNLNNFESQSDWEVNINDASEVRHWMQHWNVTEVELRKAVAEVGTDVTEVRIALGK